MSRIGVIGAGAWGTALAVSIARAGNITTLWGRRFAALIQDRENVRYLPGVKFPETMTAVSHLEAVCNTDAILLAVPAQQVREMARKLAPHLSPEAQIVVCAKGIERATGKDLITVMTEEIPSASIAILSGPTFAVELAEGKPAAATLAARDGAVAARLAAILSNPSLRLYHSTDVIGVELGGALKNVIAIACGIVIGSGLGDNARAALMTRGLAEVSRLALKMGAYPETLMGLSGLGDIALSCTSTQSRNFSLGLRVGKGVDPADAAAGILVEGIATAEAVLTLADAQGVEMPICRAVHDILSGKATVEGTMIDLMVRPLKRENG